MRERVGPMMVETSGPVRGLTRADLMTAREVAEMLDVPISTILHWGRVGLLPRIKLGRHVRFVRAHIERALYAAESDFRA